MTTSHRKNFFRASFGAAGLALAVFSGIAPVAAADAENASSSCRQEVRRVAVWPQGGNPKFAQVARFENREVTVCDGKVVSQKPLRNASNAEQGTR